ncbi:MAG: hypothetical protein CTY20_14675 [Hyphomicrobium sp.]|nr:hypothetical protein [Hyphomicrobium sp.]PPD26285.1 MAG: hypothetical protein CTY20_14675 [Hyphomicrobium sp.]
MTTRWPWMLASVAAVLLASSTIGSAGTAHAQAGMHKGGGGGPGIGAGPGKGAGPRVIVPKGPSVGPGPLVKKPPAAIKPNVSAPKVKHAHRPWRPGLKWRWLVVPTIIIAESLNWCHTHRYPVAGMRYHRHAECHRHGRWNHPSLRYVEGW